MSVFKTSTTVSFNETSNITVEKAMCVLQTMSSHKVVNLIYLIECNLIPFFIMLVSSVLTVRVLVLSRHRIEAIENRELKNRRAKDIKFAVNSFVLCILFVLFQTPITIGYFLYLPDIATYTIYFLIGEILYFLNYTLPIFTYVVTNSIFRREILKMLGLRRYMRQSTTQTRVGTKT